MSWAVKWAAVAAGLTLVLAVAWWANRQIEADACLDAGYVFDWERGVCDLVAQRLPGPTRWYDRLF